MGFTSQWEACKHHTIRRACVMVDRAANIFGKHDLPYVLRIQVQAEVSPQLPNLHRPRPTPFPRWMLKHMLLDSTESIAPPPRSIAAESAGMFTACCTDIKFLFHFYHLQGSLSLLQV